LAVIELAKFNALCGIVPVVEKAIVSDATPAIILFNLPRIIKTTFLNFKKSCRKIYVDKIIS
jgi:hypothetical protein